MTYKIFYKYILTNLLVGKKFEEYKDKKILNKFKLYPIDFNDINRIYEKKENIKNCCIVIVKDNIIVKILDID